MRTRNSFASWVMLLGAGLALAFAAGCSKSGSSDPPAQPNPALPALEVTSASLHAGQAVPAPYACTDDAHLGKSPPLAWSAGPEGTAGYAVTAIDPDARNFVHWAVVGIPKEVTSLADGASEQSMPRGARELANDFGKPGYGGPCPPKGALHHYVFRVYALKAPVQATKADASLLEELNRDAIASGAITATFQR